MKKKLHEKLINRAVQFIRDALNDANQGFFDLALVHLEQALQLLLKAKIFEKFGEFPATHSIKVLLKTLDEEDLLNKNREIINILETSYIAGRYYDIEFEREDFEKTLGFVKSVFEKYGVRID